MLKEYVQLPIEKEWRIKAETSYSFYQGLWISQPHQAEKAAPWEDINYRIVQIQSCGGGQVLCFLIGCCLMLGCKKVTDMTKCILSEY